MAAIGRFGNPIDSLLFTLRTSDLGKPLRSRSAGPRCRDRALVEITKPFDFRRSTSLPPSCHLSAQNRSARPLHGFARDVALRAPLDASAPQDAQPATLRQVARGWEPDSPNPNATSLRKPIAAAVTPLAAGSRPNENRIRYAAKSTVWHYSASLDASSRRMPKRNPRSHFAAPSECHARTIRLCQTVEFAAHDLAKTRNRAARGPGVQGADKRGKAAGARPGGTGWSRRGQAGRRDRRLVRRGGAARRDGAAGAAQPERTRSTSPIRAARARNETERPEGRSARMPRMRLNARS